MDFSDNPKPYNSYGNGAAMRVSAAGFAAESLEEAKELSKLVTEVSHNHPEGIKVLRQLQLQFIWLNQAAAFLKLEITLMKIIIL